MTRTQSAKRLRAAILGVETLASELLSLNTLSAPTRVTWELNLRGSIPALLSDASRAVASIEEEAAKRSGRGRPGRNARNADH